MEISGFGYQGFKINGDAPKIDGYTLVSSPKTLGLSYEDGIIAPYEVGKTYTQYITDDVYVKQTVIDTNGTVRATAYYKKQPLGASASKILGHNDSMSFRAGGQRYTYNNRINDVDGAMVYYYQKVGEEGKRSQLRVHYIDVTKDTDDSQYAPGDGVPATNPISGNPQTYTGNIGDTYDYATNAKIPEGYVLVGTSPNIKGTFSKSDHDAYIYVKIDRNGAKATIENLTHLNHAQKQAAEAAIDQATDLNTMNQAISTATTLDGDMGKLSDLTADLTNTNNYKYASDKPKSTVAADYTNADVLLDKDDKTAGQNADDATVLKLIDQINTHKSSLDGDTNLSAAETTISGLTHLNDAQRSAANQAVTNASDLTGLNTAVGNAQSVDSAMSDLQTAVNQANEAKTTNNYLQASADKKDNLNSAVQNAQAVLAATGANDSANKVKALTNSVNDAVDALDGDAINAINIALADKKTAINGTNLTAEEKSTLVGQAQKLADDAIANINKATTNDAVKTAKDTGVETINNMNVPTTSATKDAAINAINTALSAKKTAINDTNLTAEEKSTLVGQAQKLADDAIADINKATTNDAVNTAKENGVQAIKNMTIPTVSDVKKNAKAAIDKAVKTKDDAIDASNLTTEEKDDLKKKVAAAANEAKGKIDAATKDADVKSAKNTGVGKINNINVTSATKADANKAIDDALAKKIDEINKSNLTDEEKAKLTTDANADANNAKANIQAAKTKDAVNTAKKTGIAAINGIPVKSNSVDDQDNSAINEGNGNQAGHIQSDNSSDVTKHSSTQQSGNVIDADKDTIPGKDLIIGVKGEGISGNNAEGMNENTAKSGSKNNSLKTLPQTGTKDVTILEILGLFLSLFGLLGLKKKHREE